jgi:TRAP-type C4-dicarboxylate transport system substrate-binding protein
MKRALILSLGVVLALAMGLAVAACGGEEETITTGASTTAAPETTTTEGKTSTTERETTTTTVSAQEPITIKYATTFIETEAGGKIIQHFIDYVEEKTGGAVTFNPYFGGTLGTNMEELGLVGSGSVDIISLDYPLFADQLPFLNFPMWAPPDAQTAMDYFNHLTFENPDTSILIQGEAAKNNIIYLGFTAGGGNVFLAKEPFATLADLGGREFGASAFAPAFEALGLTVVQSFPLDTYENLSQGVIEATWMSFVPTINLKWYESAKYYKFDGTCAASNVFSVNLDTWAKLIPETQQIFKDAAKETEAFSLGLDSADTEASITMLTEAGVEVGWLSDEDIAKWWNLLFTASADDCMTRAETLGIVGEMTTVLGVAAGFTGVTWPAQ